MKKNNKGFTLIELLAVIVIMGVLMMIAIPAITKYITQSRKDAFVDTAKSYINAVRYMYLNDELSCSGSNCNPNKIYVGISPAMLEKGGYSSWGNNKIIKGYVTVDVEESDKAVYSFIGTDGTHGISKLTAEDDLNRDSVSTTGASYPGVPSDYVKYTPPASECSVYPYC